MVTLSLAPAALARPPVVPSTFCVVDPVSCGFCATFCAVTWMNGAETKAEAPTVAVVLAVTSLMMSAPTPASRPPAKVVICALKAAICSAPTTK